MASSLIQVRIDEKIKNESSEIFHNLGLDMSSAIRLFLNRVILVQGLPFAMKLHDENMQDWNDVQSLDEDKTSQPIFNPSEYLQSLIEEKRD